MVKKDGLVISLSGVRGVWNTNLDKNVISTLCLAADDIYAANKIKTSNLIVARDTRPSSNQIFNIVCNIFSLLNYQIINLGICPTPTLQINIENTKCVGGIMITASHNPPQFNGLKFYNSNGQIFLPGQAKQLEKKFKQIKIDQIKDLVKRKKNHQIDKISAKSVYQKHFDKIFEKIDVNLIRSKKFKVVIDPANGAASQFDQIFLDLLGCKVTMINHQTDGVFRRGIEPIACNLQQLMNTTKKTKAVVGFAQDADADRLAIVDNNGKMLADQTMLALVIKHFMVNKKNNKKIVTNIATTKLIDDLVKEYQGEIYKTAVGEINVLNGIIENQAQIGGEGCGGLIWPEITKGRDSFSAMALILEYLAQSGKTLSTSISELKPYFLVADKINWQNQINLDSFYQNLEAKNWGLDIKKIDHIDGLRIDFPDSWILFRPSNTEPIFRIFVESKNKNTAQQLMKKARHFFTNIKT